MLKHPASYLLILLGLTLPHAAHSLPELTTPDREIPLFHWTGSEKAFKDPSGKVRYNIAGSFERNLQLVKENMGNRVPRGMAMGHGYYTSLNPLDSSQVGPFLNITFLKPKQKLAYHPRVTLSSQIDEQWAEAVTCSRGGIFHTWDSRLTSGIGALGEAPAVRLKESSPQSPYDELIVDKKTVAIDTRGPGPLFKDLPPYKREDYFQESAVDVVKFMQDYGKLRPFFGPLAKVIISGDTNLLMYFPEANFNYEQAEKLKVAGQALLYEITKSGQSIHYFQKKIEGNQVSATFKQCLEEKQERAAEEEGEAAYDNRDILGDKELHPCPDFAKSLLSDDENMSLQDKVLVLQELGYLATSDSISTGEGIFKVIRGKFMSDPQKFDKAYGIFKGMKEMVQKLNKNISSDE